jgi:hypothetical protein
MIKLKDLLLEGVDAQWVKHAFELAWMNEAFPITPEIGKMLNKGKRVRTFHITSIKRLDQLNGLQGTKKTISTTTKVPNSTISNGLMGIWEDGVLFYLEGTLLVKGLDDIMSKPDNEGRRWLNFRDETHSNIYTLWASEFSKNKFKQRGREISHMETFGDEQNKEIRKFLKDYIDVATKFAKTHKKDILSYFADMDNTYADWNEFLVNEIQLIDVIWDTSYISDYAPTAKTSKEKEIKKIEAKLKSMVSGEVITVNQWKPDARGKIITFSKKKTK